MREYGTLWHHVLVFTLVLGASLVAGCDRDVTPATMHTEDDSGSDDDGNTDDSAGEDGADGDVAGDDGSDADVTSDDAPSVDDDPVAGDDGSPDDGGDGADAGCVLAEQTFQAFVAEHRSCEHDEDCAPVGDCGPNADFTAVRADAAKEAYSLMSQRCSGTFDGPIYGAICADGVCAIGEEEVDCCGCPEKWDGGVF
jgi:hypothetical protein